jgi:short-subunit dehydrogenase
MAEPKSEAFRAKYGPWAMIAGASEGTGEWYARELAAAGLNLVLMARRQQVLAALAADLRARHGVEVRTARIDLYDADAAQQVLAAAEGLEVGLYVNNAGAGGGGGKTFLEASVDDSCALVRRNLITLMQVLHVLAGRMKDRGRGGLILMSSISALGGMPNTAVYTGAKAFDTTFAEGLWAELRPFGVDVIGCMAPTMLTPPIERLMAGRSFPDIYHPRDVVQATIESLDNGPTCVFTAFGMSRDEADQIAQDRRAHVERVIELSKTFFAKS